ncbi:hypothetical protein [Brevibacillus centrosporus]|uniref:Uncharacterized protein n=1 Tax=Brevibacillus centrosporus TaxID=54910 RepID=A0A1I3L9T1_9BACL|nr:hypothetical protein [Brevibacillus centrosporus]MED4907035.1 hypothetical protein [Brevibacillus centrosporus]SFI81155.1 hypothetical protein SAMN05518846_101224 [Brevibacillus centrosporus]
MPTTVKITVRQMMIIIIMFTIGTTILVAPSTMAQASGQFLILLFLIIPVVSLRLGIEPFADAAEIFFPWFLFLFLFLVLTTRLLSEEDSC